ncbi:hypothetical protein V1523DRAFT_440785 [Lipomyces doorenjongii]
MQLTKTVDNSIVTAGRPVSGIVDLELDRPTIIDSVKVRFRGISMTTELKYSSPSPYSGYISPEQQKLREWHIHIDITTTLFEGQKGHRQTWTCTGALSGEVGDSPLPPSYEDNGDRYVRYEIIAVVDLPGKLENMSLVRNVISSHRLAGATSDDRLIFIFKKVPENNIQDGPTRQANGIFRSFRMTQTKSHIQIPTKLQVNIANDGQASIMEPLKVQILIRFQVNKTLLCLDPVDFRLTSMMVIMKSLTSRLTDIGKPVSVAENILYKGDSLNVPLRAESVGDSLGFPGSILVPSFYLMNLYHHHQLEVTIGFSLNGSSNRTIAYVCPIKIISGVDYDLDTVSLSAIMMVPKLPNNPTH